MIPARSRRLTAYRARARNTPAPPRGRGPSYKAPFWSGGAFGGGTRLSGSRLVWAGRTQTTADRLLQIPSVGIEVWRACGLRDLRGRQRGAVIALLSVPLAEFERRDQYSRRVAVGAGASALSHQSVQGFLRARLRSIPYGAAACGVVHDRPATASRRGADHPAGPTAVKGHPRR